MSRKTYFAAAVSVSCMLLCLALGFAALVVPLLPTAQAGGPRRSFCHVSESSTQITSVCRFYSHGAIIAKTTTTFSVASDNVANEVTTYSEGKVVGRSKTSSGPSGTSQTAEGNGISQSSGGGIAISGRDNTGESR